MLPPIATTSTSAAAAVAVAAAVVHFSDTRSFAKSLNVHFYSSFINFNIESDYLFSIIIMSK